MWPFKKQEKPKETETAEPKKILVSQLDITERFDDNKGLGPDEWIETIPMNSMVPDPQAMGLPPIGTDEKETYRIASSLSSLREALPIPGDGVYCPICHIANVDLRRLRTPCPRCGRELLKFGWD
jgi:hypothetical protein